jgi:hypothetical protein
MRNDIKSFQSRQKYIDGGRWGFPGKQLLFVVEYGLHQLGDQLPHFSITASVRKPWKVAYGDDPWVACGCLHDEIREHFPVLAPLIRWHLCDQSGTPIHYLANSLYHLEQGKVDYFKSTCVYGALPSDVQFNPTDHSGPSTDQQPIQELAKDFLMRRLPLLREAFVQGMKLAGVRPIISGKAGDW